MSRAAMDKLRAAKMMRTKENGEVIPTTRNKLDEAIQLLHTVHADILDRCDEKDTGRRCNQRLDALIVNVALTGLKDIR